MTPERWKRIIELFHAASELPPDERPPFLEANSAGDPDLLDEVLAMLEEVTSEQPLPEAEPPAFDPDRVLASRYRIVRFLSRGGMGEVYEAEDLELRAHIALKTLLPSIAADARMIARFKQEIQLSRKIGHPNVCRVYDISRDPPDPSALGPTTYFLTMELLPGETLATRLHREGPMDPRIALPLLRQMAEALDAAHSAGVIHRDFKPSNVMLVPAEGGERAIITDFGLARRIVSSAGENTGSHSTNVMGTFDYMAPELFSGHPATIASDVYAIAVVARKMLTAEDLSTCKGAIQQALHPDPAQRPRSAGDFVRTLEPSRGRQWTTSANLKKLAAAAVLVSLFYAGFRLYEHQPALPAGGSILMADIMNTTGDRELDATTELLRSQLSQSADFNLWDGSRTATVLRQMNRPAGEPLKPGIARDMALRENVPYILFGSVSPIADGFNLTLQLEQLQHASPFSRSVWNFTSQTRGKAQFQDAVRDGSKWVRSKLGEQPADIAAHDRLPQDTTTYSWQALATYAQGEQFKAKGQSETAIAIYKQAVALDPHFALAYMRLGDVMTSLGRSEDGLKYWDLAIREANGQHLTRREELRIRGLYANDTQDYEAAEAAFAQMAAEYPHDYLASFYLGSVLRWRGRLEESRQAFLASKQEQPKSLPVIGNLAATSYLLGRDQEVRGLADQLRSLGYQPHASHYEGLVAFAAGQYSDALRAFQKEAEGPDNPERSRGAYYVGALLCELGRFAEAAALLRTEAEADKKRGYVEQRLAKIVALAYATARAGNSNEAKRLCAEAAQGNNPHHAAMAGILLTQLGEIKDARAIASQLRAAPANAANRAEYLRLEGEIDLRAGDTAAALRSFRELDSIEPPLRHREYLGRALLRSGAAAQAVPYFDALLSGRVLWQSLQRDYPGFTTDALVDTARVAHAVGDSDRLTRAVALYQARRGLNSNSPEAREIARLSLTRR